MSTYIVTVEHDDTTPDEWPVLGPFRTYEKAKEFAAKIEARIPLHTVHMVSVGVTLVETPRVRAVMQYLREKDWLLTDDEELARIREQYPDTYHQ